MQVWRALAHSPCSLAQASHQAELQAAREQHSRQLEQALALAAAPWQAKVAAAERAAEELQQRVAVLEAGLTDARASIPWTPKAVEVGFESATCSSLLHMMWSSCLPDAPREPRQGEFSVYCSCIPPALTHCSIAALLRLAQASGQPVAVAAQLAH